MSKLTEQEVKDLVIKYFRIHSDYKGHRNGTTFYWWGITNTGISYVGVSKWGGGPLLHIPFSNPEKINQHIKITELMTADQLKRFYEKSEEGSENG